MWINEYAEYAIRPFFFTGFDQQTMMCWFFAIYTSFYRISQVGFFTVICIDFKLDSLCAFLKFLLSFDIN